MGRRKSSEERINRIRYYPIRERDERGRDQVVGWVAEWTDSKGVFYRGEGPSKGKAKKNMVPVLQAVLSAQSQLVAAL